ncbi:hypothetical protein AVME950_17735 [Acidovorax sp. SUPP950]|uniref:hypothetical protein n=1 Tax=Acidovorax sp. SUPP950 TaxID=511901 RepID=UPI0023C58E7C|nr:hypothetical protein [Acidovorax sp. SUPP950]GKS76765.1 hypothetical protein AVME950_17735 [Acidovorax sp. SUPP950]
MHAALADFTRCDTRVQEALAALAQSPTVGAAARALGVSERTLERLMRTATGEPPRYWRALARVRRAAQALAGDGARPWPPSRRTMATPTRRISAANAGTGWDRRPPG